MSSSSNEIPPEDIWTEADKRQFDADFEMAVDMFEFALAEKGKGLPNDEKDNVLERFKKSDYESAKRLRI